MMLFDNRSIHVTDISLWLNVSSSGTAVTVEIILPSANQSEQVMRLLNGFSSFTMVGNYFLSGQSQDYILINGSRKLRKRTVITIII